MSVDMSRIHRPAPVILSEAKDPMPAYTVSVHRGILATEHSACRPAPNPASPPVVHANTGSFDCVGARFATANSAQDDTELGKQKSRDQRMVPASSWLVARSKLVGSGG